MRLSHVAAADQPHAYVRHPASSWHFASACKQDFPPLGSPVKAARRPYAARRFDAPNRYLRTREAVLPGNAPLTDLDCTRPLAAIVVGRAGMDLYPAPDGTRIEDAVTFAADVGGAAGNIAVALARQGARVALVTAFSDDAVGRFVRARLSELGVDTVHCRVVGGERRTSLALAETRAADGKVVIYRNNAADLDLPEIDAGVVGGAAALIVTGTALAAEPSRSRTFAAIAAARRAKTFVVLDIDHRPYSWPTIAAAVAAYTTAAAASDAVIGNVEEFALLGGPGSDAHDIAQAMVAKGSTFVVVKKGAAGAATYGSDGAFETPAFPVVAKKPFGAGDAFLGTLVATLARGEGLPLAVEWGAAAAAIVVSRRGCASAMPTFEETGDFIAGRFTHEKRGAFAHSAL